jgi:uncharacterized OsmC-like protein
MKTSAKWISGNSYILNNSKYLNIAISDPLKREDNYELNCLDLVLMGFTGCVTAEFKKHLADHSIEIKGIETDVEIENLPNAHPNFAIHLLCKVKSNAKSELLKNCLDEAINTSFLALLFKEAGIIIHADLAVSVTPQYLESYVN